MFGQGVAGQPLVHCRVGSSEKALAEAGHSVTVHCRVGSSEMVLKRVDETRVVHCRVGSSESRTQ